MFMPPSLTGMSSRLLDYPGGGYRGLHYMPPPPSPSQRGDDDSPTMIRIKQEPRGSPLGYAEEFPFHPEGGVPRPRSSTGNASSASYRDMLMDREKEFVDMVNLHSESPDEMNPDPDGNDRRMSSGGKEMANLAEFEAEVHDFSRRSSWTGSGSSASGTAVSGTGKTAASGGTPSPTNSARGSLSPPRSPAQYSPLPFLSPLLSMAPSPRGPLGVGPPSAPPVYRHPGTPSPPGYPHHHHHTGPPAYPHPPSPGRYFMQRAAPLHTGVHTGMLHDRSYLHHHKGVNMHVSTQYTGQGTDRCVVSVITPTPGQCFGQDLFF